MRRWVDTLSDGQARSDLGRRFEALTDEAFNILRWTLVVGFLRFLAVNAGSVWFDVIHWSASALLFGALASRFLLRPELPVFASLDQRWKRRVQTAVNLGLCLLAFLLVMWLIEHLVDGVARYRFAPVAS